MASSLPSGTTPVVTKLYEQEFVHWSTFASEAEQKNAMETKMADMPIVQRFTHKHKSWVTKSFTVNSPLMRKLLSKVLENYQDLDLGCEKWTFSSPYIPLVHRWHRLQDFLQTASDPAMVKAAQDLIDFLLPLVKPSVEALEQTRLKDAICRITRNRKRAQHTDKNRWEILLKYIDWDGDQFGYKTMETIIEDYDGHRRIQSLPIWPISFATDPSAIRSKMIVRGRKFEEMRTYHFMQYEGRKVVTGGDVKEEEPVSGRVIMDASAYYTSCKIDDDWEEGSRCSLDDNKSNNSEDECIFNKLKLKEKIADTKPERTQVFTPLTDEQCLLTNPWVPGFDLKAKEWGLFIVEEMKEIAWNDDAFENLNKSLSNLDFDDFLADKGRGITILMFGPPDVGKTYTAEAVAERSRVPLYYMSVGALGTNPNEIEKALDRALELCRLWNAMLLLDEADVFLGTRREDTLARNELVSMFLSKLEYYQGILFLTTNRAASLDHAFQSRVDLLLPYSNLTADARRQLWQNFVKHAGGAKRFKIGDEDYNRLSLLNLNGREIKNLIKSARLLGMKSGQHVTADRLVQLAKKRVEAIEILNGGGETFK
ncbi:P-loop containing nucleoside triphosphate hydrolase protein [Trichoderma evansii]